MVPVKVLFWSHNSFNPGSKFGITPCKLLLCTRSSEKFGDGKRAIGSVPVNILLYAWNVSKLTRLANSIGKVPSNILFANQRFKRLVALPIEDGIVPISLFLIAHKSSSNVSVPTSSGMVPVSILAETRYDLSLGTSFRLSKAGPEKELSSTSNSKRLEKPTKLGKDPVNELLKNAITSSDLSSENSGVIGPARLLSAKTKS